MEIRRFEERDTQKVLELFKKSFGKPMTKDFWEWRYLRNPFSSAKVIHLMWHEEALAGHYAVWPAELLVGDEVKMTAMSMTTMTHPDFAGKGVFTSLAKSVYDSVFNEHQIELIWGFPNVNSHYGFIKKLDWKNVATIPMLSMQAKFMDRLPRVDVVSKNSFDESDSHQLMKCTMGKIKLNKTSEYLNWRYFDNPEFNYQVISPKESPDLFIVFKVVKPLVQEGFMEIDILEWSTRADVQSIVSLLAALKSHLKSNELEIATINTWMNISDDRHIYLEKNGFQITSPVTYLGGLQSQSNSKTDFLDFRKWNISMGDSDVF